MFSLKESLVGLERFLDAVKMDTQYLGPSPHVFFRIIRSSAEDHERLADWILKHHPEEIGKGDPQRGESASEVAIRLIRERDTLIKELKAKTEILEKSTEEFADEVEAQQSKIVRLKEYSDEGYQENEAQRKQIARMRSAIDAATDYLQRIEQGSRDPEIKKEDIGMACREADAVIQSRLSHPNCDLCGGSGYETGSINQETMEFIPGPGSVRRGCPKGCKPRAPTISHEEVEQTIQRSQECAEKELRSVLDRVFGRARNVRLDSSKGDKK